MSHIEEGRQQREQSNPNKPEKRRRVFKAVGVATVGLGIMSVFTGALDNTLNQNHANQVMGQINNQYPPLSDDRRAIDKAILDSNEKHEYVPSGLLDLANMDKRHQSEREHQIAVLLPDGAHPSDPVANDLGLGGVALAAVGAGIIYANRRRRPVSEGPIRARDVAKFVKLAVKEEFIKKF